VVENGSTDNGPEIVQEFSDTRIRLAVSTKCGPGVARNFGLGLSSGKWILFLDADDLIEPGYLYEKLKTASALPQSGIVAGCWHEFVDGNRISTTLKSPAAYERSTAELCNSAIAYAPWALHAAIVRKAILPDVGAWPEELDGLPSEDAAFWFPLICTTDVAWSADAGALYRTQTGNSRNEIAEIEKWAHAAAATIDRNVRIWMDKKPGLTHEQTANIFRVFENLYRTALTRHDRRAAAAMLQLASQRLNASSSDNPAINIRKLVGLKLFNLIRFGLI